MEKYQGVAITDGVNRKNHILPLNAIIKAYRDTYNKNAVDYLAAKKRKFKQIAKLNKHNYKQ